MNYFYFDASALAKRYSHEKGTDLINIIFENVKPSRMMCLLLGSSEVVSVLVRKHNDGRISNTTFSQAKCYLLH